MDELERQIAEKTAEFAKEIAEDISRPSSKSIGTNLGLMVDGVFGWLGTWGQIQKMKQAKYMEDYKEKLYSKIENIPEEDLIEPNINIVGPAIEASKYFFEEEYYQEMFTNLIAASCDVKQKSKIHPSYVAIIKQLSPLDAKVLELFKSHNTYPVANLNATIDDKTITPCTILLCDFKENNKYFSAEEFLEISSSIDNLIRLNLIRKNKEVLELGYDYSKFELNTFYIAFSKSVDQKSKINIVKYRIELTNFGSNFFNICCKK